MKAALRDMAACVVVAVALALASFYVPGAHLMDCGGDDPRPCTQVAGGFPLIWAVDHPGVSPANRVDLISTLLGEDLFLARNFWADVLIWLAAVAAAVAIWRTPRRQAAPTD